MTESVWDYPRPPRVEPSARLIEIRHRGAVLVSTTGALRVLETSHPPVYYVDRADVHGALSPSERRSFCEYKGWASYWHCAGVRDAAWSYETPSAGYETLTGRLAFYPSKFDECLVDGERIVPQPGDFYGGWITGDLAGPFKGGEGTAGW